MRVLVLLQCFQQSGDQIGRRNPERLEPYLKISVIRNPWSRFFSLHSYLIKARPRKDLDIPEDINDFASLLANESPEWMKTIRSLRPQIDFIECAENNLALLYYETLSADFEQLSHRINVAAPLPHQNKSNSQKADYRAFLAPKTVDFVTDKFIADVERFNYKFE